MVGGASKAALLLCEALVSIGHRVRLFVTLPPEPDIRSKLEARGVRISTPHTIIPTAYCKGWRWGIPQRMIAFQVFAQAWRKSPDMIHVVSLSPEARHLLRLPKTAPVLLWETTEAQPNGAFVDMKIARYIDKADAVLVPSNSIARNVRSTYQYQGPIRLLPFWAEEPPPTANGRSHARTNEILYLGRMSMDKGFEYLFDAFRELHDSAPAAKLVVCGGGSVAPVRAMARNHPAIEVRGFVAAEEFERLIDRCDAVVLPSLHEGYPLSLLEACARGKPVISTAVGSIPEVFGNRRCALLVPPRDAGRLAAAITQVLSDGDDVYRERCHDARRLFTEISAQEIVRANLSAIYNTADMSTAVPLKASEVA